MYELRGALIDGSLEESTEGQKKIKVKGKKKADGERGLDKIKGMSILD